MKDYVKLTRSMADKYAKMKAQMPTGGNHVTASNAIAQRAAQQARATVGRKKRRM